jgi:hypothetical protein
MKFSILSNLLAALMLMHSAGMAVAESSNWAEYRNEKYGLQLAYPANLFGVERTAEAGDGQVFVTRDGDARLLVGALVNDTHFTPATYQSHISRESYGKFHITYHPTGKTWFVLSGEGEGKIFYEKVVFSCSGRLINSFAMIYPGNKRELFNPVVERMEGTFRPGSECENAGLPSNRRPERARPHNRQGFARVPRSALADRIARKRGHDVIVILQRTAPPYDRKAVRGYVSR